MATITGNYVYADPTQWWTLDYTFANSKFTWSVTAHASFTSYWNSIYGLTVNVGGNSYYKGDIDWRNYTPNTVVYNGTTNLSDCTVSNGVVTLSVSGNFYYGTWSSDYRSSGSGTCAVDPPTVATLSTPTITNQYSGMTVAGRSVITFRMKGTSQTGSTTMSYSLYQNGTVISTSSGTSGQNKDVTVTAPSAGSHSYYYKATDGNGTTSTSGTISITTYAYQPPSFNSASAVRWSTGNSSGTASDTGKYAKCTATWNVGKVGSTNLTTTLKVSTSSPAHSTTTTTSGTAVWIGSNDYSADNSYTVTFLLYDNYTGEGNGVTRTDTLTQGGRGLDFVYSNAKYGVAIGQKATSGYVDVAMPLRVNTQGNVLSLGAINSYFCHFMSSALSFYFDKTVNVNGDLLPYANSSNNCGDSSHVWKGVYATNFYGNISGGSLTTASTSAFSRSSGWSIKSQAVYTWGRVVTATMVLNSTTSVSSGSNAFAGSLASAYRPKSTVSAVSYYSGAICTGVIRADGTITVRVGGSGSAGASGDTQTFTWTYLI